MNISYIQKLHVSNELVLLSVEDAADEHEDSSNGKRKADANPCSLQLAESGGEQIY